MEECGRGAAVVQLTARGMVSIPATGGNRSYCLFVVAVNEYQSPRWGVRKNYNLMSTNQIFDLIQSYFYLY